MRRAFPYGCFCALLLAGCSSGDLCADAASHLAACVPWLEQSPSCTDSDEAFAQQLLQMECRELETAVKGAGKADWCGVFWGCDKSEPPENPRHTLYLNFDGTTLYPGKDDAPLGTCPLLAAPHRIDPISEFYLDEEDRQVVADKVQDHFREFGVEVVTERPIAGPYTMVVAKQQRFSGVSFGTTGIALKDCGDANPNNIAFVFIGIIMASSSTFSRTHVANCIAHEVGHTYGLDHIDRWNALMAPDQGELSEILKDWRSGSVVPSSQDCSTGGEQDSREVLQKNLVR